MTDAPYTPAELATAFPELDIQLPALGSGAFKAAYVARDAQGERILKVLHEPLPVDLDGLDSAQMPERFSRELAGMAKVDSPYVVRLLAPPQVRTIGTRQYVSYEEPYYPGGTLEEVLATSAGADLAVTVAEALLSAIEAMWKQAGVVHRDIKPGNIVFDPEGVPVLLDLGIAFHKDLSPLTNAWEPSPKTPRYAAPEQFEARGTVLIDFRTDHFQAGMVIYEALTGTHPFYSIGIDTNEYFRRLQTGDFDRGLLSTAAPSAAFAQAVERLLAPRPSRRFRSVEAPLQLLRGGAA